jgi:hypothetical protein
MGKLIDSDGFCWVPITVHEHDQRGKKIFFVAVRHCRSVGVGKMVLLTIDRPPTGKQNIGFLTLGH